MDPKLLKVGGRYVRRDGTVTPPLVKGVAFDWLLDTETKWEYSPTESTGNLVYPLESDDHEHDLVAVYEEQ